MKPTKVSRLLPLVACLAWNARAVAGPAPVPTLAVIQGQAPEKVKKITLFAVEEGRKAEIANAMVDEQHAFAFAIPSPKEGFYYLSVGDRSADTRIYIKPGDQLKLKMERGAYSVQAGSVENKQLWQWQEQLGTISRHIILADTATYMTFFPKLEVLVPKVTGLKKAVNTPNKKFNELLKYTMDVDVEHAAMAFLLMPHPKHPEKSQYPAFYKQIIQDKKYCDSKLLANGDAGSIVRLYETFTYIMSTEKRQGPASLEENARLFCNDTIKGLFITESLPGFRTFDKLTDAVTPVKQYLITENQQQRYLAAEKALRKFAAGEQGFNFAGEDTNGKKVTFNELKGKVVVVDVWATWCGPCKAELPHLQKLEEELRGRNVTFVGYSVDETKDKEKWSAFVKEKDMKGVQLFGAGWSEITKFYDIKGIPRFMVFDQQGKIVTIDAPRPSTPELKALIEKTLGKG
ncbi:TlpA family protein disulfide reductase [Chitinophaga varians]|uniref:TlpA family protein disulfide reductase n=1 Tax=Chitinophaga varians TaxID=2202339 RepID=UPI00165FD60E|nr:TlpA disulfide reductase family protein [Chitinophaga varians]MBC9910880.1 TlpA family protein disulfide reductase [Chitinophaga varians]